MEDYGTRAGWGVLELNNIVFSVLQLRERKQQDKSCLGSTLSLGLKSLSSCLVFVAQEAILCIVRVISIPLHIL